MIDIKISVDQSRAPNAARMAEQADEVIGGKLIEVGLIFERTVKENTPLGASRLTRGSIFSEPRGNPVREVLVSSPQPHIAVLERGRRPGTPPPFGPIWLWVQRKTGFTGARTPATAWAIVRSIARKGTPGAAMFFKGFNQGRAAAERVVESIGGAIVAEWEKK